MAVEIDKNNISFTVKYCDDNIPVIKEKGIMTFPDGSSYPIVLISGGDEPCDGILEALDTECGIEGDIRGA